MKAINAKKKEYEESLEKVSKDIDQASQFLSQKQVERERLNGALAALEELQSEEKPKAKE